MRLLGLLIALTLLLVGSDAFFQRFSSSRHRKNAGTQAADGNVQPFIRFRKSYEWNPLNRFDYGNEDDFLGDPFIRTSAGVVAAPQ